MINKGNLISEGKAKSLFETENQQELMMVYRDDTSAFDGKKKEALKGKGEINNIFNSTLQLKLDKTLSSSARFVINSTVGVFGLFDIATSLGIERHREDFGQTLGHYGVPAGPYLVLPFFGPSTFRDAPGFYADIAVEKSISPVHTELHHEERQLIQATNVIDTRANLLQATKILDTAAKDKYIFLRESYLQKRTKMIADGKNVQDFEIDVLEINY